MCFRCCLYSQIRICGTHLSAHVLIVVSVWNFVRWLLWEPWSRRCSAVSPSNFAWVENLRLWHYLAVLSGVASLFHEAWLHLSLMCLMHQHRVQYVIRLPVRKGVTMHKVLSVEIRSYESKGVWDKLRFDYLDGNAFFICCGHVSLDTSIAYFSSLLPRCPTSENVIWRSCCRKASSINLAADTARFNCSNGRRFYRHSWRRRQWRWQRKSAIVSTWLFTLDLLWSWARHSTE